MCDDWWDWIYETFSCVTAGLTATCGLFDIIMTLYPGEVHAKMQQAIGQHDLLTTVKRRKLQWYGHVSRSSGLAKTILQ